MLKVRASVISTRAFSSASYTRFSNSVWLADDAKPEIKKNSNEDENNNYHSIKNGSQKKQLASNPALNKDKLDLSLLENAYKKYEKISLNSLESTYLSSKIAPLNTPAQLKNYLAQNRKNATFEGFKNFNYLPLNFGSNQNIKLKDPRSAQRLKQILTEFRNAPVKYCFAYGSSVFKQSNNDPNKQTQTDLIFATTFSDHFHSLNLNRHADHYSFMRKLGSGFITRVQDFGPGVYFNPFVKVDNNLVKYGVISIEKTVNDLLNWDNMYMAGRLHKPVKILKDDARIRFINQENLRNAVSLSLLLLLSDPKNQNSNNTFSVFQLFETVTGLSYHGDIRTKIGGESPKKISNIVSGQFNEFQELYAPLMQIFASDEFIQFTDADISKFQVNDSDTYKAHLLENLPASYKEKVYKLFVTSATGRSVAVDDASRQVLSGATRHQFHDIFKASSSFYATNGNRKQHFIYQQPSSIKTDTSVYEQGEVFKPTEFSLALANAPELHKVLLDSLERTIFVPSIVQSVKGIFTAGFSKSFNYAMEKRSKYNQGKQ